MNTPPYSVSHCSPLHTNHRGTHKNLVETRQMKVCRPFSMKVAPLTDSQSHSLDFPLLRERNWAAEQFQDREILLKVLFHSIPPPIPSFMSKDISSMMILCYGRQSRMAPFLWLIKLLIFPILLNFSLHRGRIKCSNQQRKLYGKWRLEGTYIKLQGSTQYNYPTISGRVKKVGVSPSKFQSDSNLYTNS